MDVYEKVNFARAALKHCSAGHSDHIFLLHILATSLQCRFHQQGTIADLDEAVILWHNVLDIRLLGNAFYATSLHELALCLSDRFMKLATAADLHDTIKFERVASELRPPGYPDHVESRTCLANLLQLKLKGRGTIPQLPRPSDPTFSLQMKKLVRNIAFEVLRAFPSRLLDTHTGMLCD
ncbi:hypothetical protein V8B97DRAFT_289547 [Scleroderma yunnanense]